MKDIYLLYEDAILEVMHSNSVDEVEHEMIIDVGRDLSLIHI